jgi:hypothetical protein
LVLLVVTLPASCAYERRSTLLYPITSQSTITPSNQPPYLWSVTVRSAQIPPRKPSGLAWDNDKTPPDPYVILYVDNRKVWQSPVIEDTLNPKWEILLPRNVIIGPSSSLRIEMWDKDTPPAADPIGRIQHIGLPPTAQPNAVARLMMDTGAVLTITVAPPRAHKGLGITWFEVRPAALIALEVEKYSPAGRAGIRAGDQIAAIDNRSVESLGDARACGLLSLSAERGYTLGVVDSKGVKRTVKLDSGLVWLTM